MYTIVPCSKCTGSVHLLV